jgi:peptidoglycan/xylan/chitin deacetylase (PgdA/CDA1 family)
VKIRLIFSLVILLLIIVFGCRTGASPETANAQIPPVTIPPDAKLVSLFFDDGFLNQYQAAFPVLQENNFRATFGVITGSIGKGSDLWQYMDKKTLRKMAAAGMDIASHTVSHASLTTNITDKRLRQEVFDSKTELEKMGFKVSTMIYPYYEWNDRAIACVTEAEYTCARAGWSSEKAYNLTTTDPKARYHVFSWQITNQNMDTFKLYLKEAGPDTLVGLTYHFIADKGPAATTTPVGSFKAQMAYLKEAGFTVVPLPQFFSK